VSAAPGAVAQTTGRGYCEGASAFNSKPQSSKEHSAAAADR
jgi:hypothetical protein